MRLNGRVIGTTAAAGLLAVTAAANAAVDNVRAIFSASDDTSGQISGQLGGFGYDPINNRLYLSTIGTQLFRVDGVGATPAVTRLVTPSQYSAFTFNRQPVPFGFMINPVTFNGNAPYTTALITDTHGPTSGVALTDYRRMYAFNLQVDTGAAGASTSLTGLVDAKKISDAAFASNGAAANVSSGIRGPRFGNDGSSAYFTIGTSTTTGVYRYDAVSGNVSRLPTLGTGSVGTQEVGVQKISDTKDRILFTDAAANLYAIDYTYTPGTGTGTYGTQQTLLTADQIRQFYRGASTSLFSINNIVADGDNIYIQAGTGQASQPRNAFLRFDAQGRLAKVATQNEIRTVKSGQGNSYTSTQIVTPSTGPKQLYYGNTTNNQAYIGAIALYEPGDFDRDGSVTTADAAALIASNSIKPVGTTTTNSDLFKFDLNGDSVQSGTTYAATVDYYDVKVFQQFLGFANGDADMNLALNFADINVARDNYLASGAIWTQGDWSGDGLVNFNDLAILADAWVYGLNQTRLSAADIDNAGYVGQFRNDLVTAFNVPEPAALSVLAAVTVLAGRRRRNG